MAYLDTDTIRSKNETADNLYRIELIPILCVEIDFLRERVQSLNREVIYAGKRIRADDTAFAKITQIVGKVFPAL